MACKRHNVNVKSLCSLMAIIMLVLPSLVPAAERDGKNKEGVYSVLDPCGIWPRIERIPLSPRLSSLKKTRIYIINSWGSGTGFETIFSKIAEVIRERQPDAFTVTIKGRNTGYSLDDPEL